MWAKADLNRLILIADLNLYRLWQQMSHNMSPNPNPNQWMPFSVSKIHVVVMIY